MASRLYGEFKLGDLIKAVGKLGGVCTLNCSSKGAEIVVTHKGGRELPRFSVTGSDLAECAKKAAADPKLYDFLDPKHEKRKRQPTGPKQ
jgi:hypothetical protein